MTDPRSSSGSEALSIEQLAVRHLISSGGDARIASTLVAFAKELLSAPAQPSSGSEEALARIIARECLARMFDDMDGVDRKCCLRAARAVQTETLTWARDCNAIIEQCAKIAEPWQGYWLDSSSTDADRAVVAVRTEIAAKIRALALPSTSQELTADQMAYCREKADATRARWREHAKAVQVPELWAAIVQRDTNINDAFALIREIAELDPNGRYRRLAREAMTALRAPTTPLTSTDRQRCAECNCGDGVCTWIASVPPAERETTR